MYDGMKSSNGVVLKSPACSVCGGQEGEGWGMRLALSLVLDVIQAMGICIAYYMQF